MVDVSSSSPEVGLITNSSPFYNFKTPWKPLDSFCEISHWLEGGMKQGKPKEVGQYLLAMGLAVTNGSRARHWAVCQRGP